MDKNMDCGPISVSSSRNKNVKPKIHKYQVDNKLPTQNVYMSNTNEDCVIDVISVGESVSEDSTNHSDGFMNIDSSIEHRQSQYMRELCGACEKNIYIHITQ